MSPTGGVRLLGVNLADDISWDQQLETGAKAVLPTCRKIIGALKLAGKFLDVKACLCLANGLVLDKIQYGIQLWGFGRLQLLKKVQVGMNTAARFVLSAGRNTRTEVLMDKCH